MAEVGGSDSSMMALFAVPVSMSETVVVNLRVMSGRIESDRATYRWTYARLTSDNQSRIIFFLDYRTACQSQFAGWTMDQSALDVALFVSVKHGFRSPHHTMRKQFMGFSVISRVPRSNNQPKPYSDIQQSERQIAKSRIHVTGGRAFGRRA